MSCSRRRRTEPPCVEMLQSSGSFPLMVPQAPSCGVFSIAVLTQHKMTGALRPPPWPYPKAASSVAADWREAPALGVVGAA
jgi:hypothetical protein